MSTFDVEEEFSILLEAVFRTNEPEYTDFEEDLQMVMDNNEEIITEVQNIDQTIQTISKIFIHFFTSLHFYSLSTYM